MRRFGERAVDVFFFFNDTATTEIYTLSLHDALPIFLKFLEKQAKDDIEAYKEFYLRFSRFLKEGIVASPEYQELLAGLLRFTSSMTEGEEVTSLPEYVDRMKDGQEEIYFLVGTNREAIEKGAFFEGFKARGLEVADRKSTRLNSSHVVISYAVFCLKKKKKT